MAKYLDPTAASKRSLHVQTARNLARDILSGKWAEGAIITGEMELCKHYGISRTPLREAIKLLASKGLLDSRPKIGTRVVSREFWNFLDPQLIEWMDGLMDIDQFCRQFLGLRKAIEPEACALAAQFATQEQRDELTAIFNRMSDIATAAEFNQQQWTEIDIQFHCLIFKSTANDFYLPFSNLLNSMYTNFIIQSSEEGNTCLEDHQRIYQAIIDQDSERAKQASYTHLNSFVHQ